MADVELTGDWAGLERWLSAMGHRFESEMESATSDNAQLLHVTIDEGFDVEGLGKKWVGHKSKAYEKKKLKAGREKLLQWTGSMRNAIQPVVEGPYEGFVGGTRQVEAGEASDYETYELLVIHDQGSRDGRIPARPIFDPALALVEDQMVERYDEAIERTIEG